MDQKLPPLKKKAAALKYDVDSDAAPILTAVGVGAAAESIIRLAEENEVPVVEDEATADVLSKLSVGDAIPPALYQAVAQILIFVSELDGNTQRKKYQL